MSYDLVPGEPAPRSRPGPRSTLVPRLIELATKYPGEQRRIFDSASAETARVLAYQLTGGKRAAYGRPVGTWEFVHGAIKDMPGRYGVWATFHPPEAEATNQKES